MIVRFNKAALISTTKEPSSAIGVEGDVPHIGKVSEVEKIVGDARRKVAEEGVPGVGVSGSNSGKGHESKMPIEEERVQMEKVVEEEPGSIEGDGKEIGSKGAEG
jgi:protein phosphatase PTC1